MALRDKIWKLLKPELRSSSWSDALSRLAAIDAGRDYTDEANSVSREIAAGLVSRCFASAKVSPLMPQLTPLVLSMISRELVADGESVWILRFAAGKLRINPVSHWRVFGSEPDDDLWQYEVSVSTPTGGQLTLIEPADNVLHFRLSYAGAQPWFGRSSFDRAKDTTRGTSNIEKRLADELNSPVGQLLPAPIAEMSDDGAAGLLASLKRLRGKPILVQSQAGGLGSGLTHGRSSGDWRQVRIGAHPPQELSILLEQLTTLSALGAGLPAEMLRSDASSSAKRESLRQVLHTLIVPLASLIEHELTRKLEQEISLDFSRLHGSDVISRARAMKSFTDAGLEADEAKRLAGFD